VKAGTVVSVQQPDQHNGPIDLSSLTRADLAAFSRLGISPELLAQAHVERVSDCEAREYGITGPVTSDMSGLVFPYFSIETGARVTARVRRDNPDMEAGKERNKYICAYGDRRHLYFVRGCADLFRDTTVPIVLVEAEKSALALTAWAERIGRKILPVAMGGCWGWRGRTGKVENAQGESVDEVGPLPDLRICYGRKVLVLLDSNASTNTKVQQARAALVRHLRSQGTDVQILDLPIGEGVNGPDDYVGLHGDEAMAELLDGSGRSESIPMPNEPRRSQATKIVKLAEGVDLFHTPDGKPYASVVVSDHYETWPTKYRAFRDYLARLFYQVEGSAPNGQAVRDALTVLDGKARYEGKEQEVFVRVAENAGHLYLDLGDPDWRAVEIGPNGWRVIGRPPVRFRRPSGMAALPVPMAGGKAASELKPFLNVANEYLVLVLAWLVAAIRPRGPYPILYFIGEQGSAKSTTQKVLRRLIDPYKAELRTAPRDERDLQIAANNSHVIAIDNMSRLDPWLSDSLCRLATGGGLATRELYSDGEEVIFDAQRPILMNGIEEVATRGDFLERTILISLPSISERERRDEKTFWAAFHEAQPRILGGLLDAVSAALKREKSIRLPCKPRMADFYIWSVAAEAALGFEDGVFVRAYERNRSDAHELALEASVIVPYIRQLVQEHGQWIGTSGELLKELNRLAKDQDARQKSWPNSPRGLSGLLRRLAPNLRAGGVAITALDRRMDKRNWQLSKLSAQQPSCPSLPSSHLPDQQLTDDPIHEQPSCQPSFPMPSETGAHDAYDGYDGYDGLVPMSAHRRNIEGFPSASGSRLAEPTPSKQEEIDI
jgi:hypothetical protein